MEHAIACKTHTLPSGGLLFKGNIDNQMAIKTSLISTEIKKNHRDVIGTHGRNFNPDEKSKGEEM